MLNVVIESWRPFVVSHRLVDDDGTETGVGAQRLHACWDRHVPVRPVEFAQRIAKALAEAGYPNVGFRCQDDDDICAATMDLAFHPDIPIETLNRAALVSGFRPDCEGCARTQGENCWWC